MRKTPTVDIDGLLDSCTRTQGTVPTPEAHTFPQETSDAADPEARALQEMVSAEVRKAFATIVLPELEAHAAKEREALLAAFREEVNRLVNVSNAPWRVY